MKWNRAHRDSTRAANKRCYEVHKEMYCKVQNERNARVREEVIVAYGGRCSFCGESIHEYLVIDHINKDPERHSSGKGRVAGAQMYARLKRAGYPKRGYRLLCANCNSCRAIYGDVVARRLGNQKKNG